MLLCSQNGSELLQSDSLVSTRFNRSRHTDLLTVAYSQLAVLVVPTTKQHAVYEEEVCCSCSAPNLQQNTGFKIYQILTVILYANISAIINVITFQ